MSTLIDLSVKKVTRVSPRHVLLTLTAATPLPVMRPGQFVEVRIDGCAEAYLRRPISIHFFDREANVLQLLVAIVGAGTQRLAELQQGDTLNCMLPLGHGFSSAAAGERVLIVGGGVGVAPLLYLGAEIQKAGAEPVFLLGARTASDLLLKEAFARYGRVYVTTEDGSAGERGFVTQHSLLQREQFSRIQTCGPTPMMKAVAAYARKTNTPCEVSLENRMACGLGACLCCVEKTSEGNLCVCKEGPVFNINRLTWQS